MITGITCGITNCIIKYQHFDLVSTDGFIKDFFNYPLEYLSNYFSHYFGKNLVVNVVSKSGDFVKE